MLITPACASIAACTHWITSAIVRSVPIDSTGAPGYMPTIPTPFARPPITEATAVPGRAASAASRRARPPAGRGTRGRARGQPPPPAAVRAAADPGGDGGAVQVGPRRVARDLHPGEVGNGWVGRRS